MLADLLLLSEKLGSCIGKMLAAALIILSPYACIAAGEYVADTYISPLFRSTAETSNTLPPTYEF